MEIGSDFDQQYDQACDGLADLGPMVQRTIDEILRTNDLRVHSVSHRVKSRSSARRKIGQKGAGYRDFDDIHDLLGLRIVTFYPDEVDAVARVVKSGFQIDPTNSVDKRSLLDPDRFGYLSFHYVASLSSTGSPEHQRFEGRKFEIQIRSILQHAWAEIEHDLGYQTVGAVPESIRRRFSRLAGLLEVADDEFLRLRNEAADYRVSVSKEIATAPETVLLNRDSLASAVSNSRNSAELDAWIAQEFGGITIRDTLSVQASDLQAAGLRTVGETMAAFDQRLDVIRRFMALWIKPELGEFGQGLGLFYLPFVLVAESGEPQRVAEYLEAVAIGHPSVRGDTALRILSAYQGAASSAAAGGPLPTRDPRR